VVFPVPMRPRRNTEEDWSDSEVLFELLSFDDANPVSPLGSKVWDGWLFYFPSSCTCTLC